MTAVIVTLASICLAAWQKNEVDAIILLRGEAD